MRNLLAMLSVLLLPTGPAQADRPPPDWTTMAADARSAFLRRSDDAVVQRVVRAGEPRLTARRTAVDLVPTCYQDAQVFYQKKKFGQIEKIVMHLHYEAGLGGWSFVGFEWGDVQVVRPGSYPPPPPPPSEQEISDAVKSGLRRWRVQPAHVERVTVTGKPSFSYVDDEPTPEYRYPVKVLVQDVVDRSAVYGARMQTRFECEFKAVLLLESQSIWTMSSTVPDCTAQGCSLPRACKDLWAKGVPPSAPPHGRRR